VKLNPLTYGVAALRHVMGMHSQAISLPVSLAVAGGFALFTLAMSTRAASKAAKGDLR
jgi:ABC-type polysaccharide/polyol phosphate export permease